MCQSFTERLVLANSLDEQGFHSWILSPGMKFGAAVTWWGLEAARPQPHEGIDLHSYTDTAGRSRRLAPGTLIPLHFHGTVVDVFPDFLGQSLLIAHDQTEEGWRLHSLIAHVETKSGIVLNRRYAAGTIVARLPASPKPGIPAHLHISTVNIFGPPPHPLSWPIIVSSNDIHVLDPTSFIGGFRKKTSRFL